MPFATLHQQRTATFICKNYDGPWSSLISNSDQPLFFCKGHHFHKIYGCFWPLVLKNKKKKKWLRSTFFETKVMVQSRGFLQLFFWPSVREYVNIDGSEIWKDTEDYAKKDFLDFSTLPIVIYYITYSQWLNAKDSGNWIPLPSNVLYGTNCSC